MGKDKGFSTSSFARLARIPRDTLLYYDRIGLLQPAFRNEATKRRSYSSRQIALVNVIRVFQELGVSLSDIRKYLREQSPETTDEILGNQIVKIAAEIEKWQRAEKLLLSMRRFIHSALDADEDGIMVRFLPAEAIVLGEPNDYSHGRNDYDVLPDFYFSLEKKYPALDLNYPAWGFFSSERIKRGDWVWPSRYYFPNPEGSDEKPAGLYVIGYARGGYGQAGDLYVRLLEYIDENEYEICGDAYEEYPLNELCVSNSENYLIRLMIGVRKKG